MNQAFRLTERDRNSKVLRLSERTYECILPAERGDVNAIVMRLSFSERETQLDFSENGRLDRGIASTLE